MDFEQVHEQNKAHSFDSTLSEDDYKYLKTLDEKFLNEYDPSDDTTKYTNEDYARLQQNIILCKEGNREASEYIIASFHRILHAYAHFIVLRKIPYYHKISKDGEVKVKINPSIMNFINLFCGKIVFNGNTLRMKGTCEYIYNLFKKFEYGDIYNELVLALLNMVAKYKVITDPNDPKYKPNGTFHVYVQKCFHFEAFHYLKRLVKDPLLTANLTNFSNEDEDDDDNIECLSKSSLTIDNDSITKYNNMIDYIDRQVALQNSNNIVLREDDIDESNLNYLNFNWIRGTVCGDVFKVLTPYERELLVLAYNNKHTEDEIAEMFNCSRAKIGSNKRKAVAKLKEELKKNYMLKEINNEKRKISDKNGVDRKIV